MSNLLETAHEESNFLLKPNWNCFCLVFHFRASFLCAGFLRRQDYPHPRRLSRRRRFRHLLPYDRRHISKYVPGNPTVVVDNVTGAGSLVAANSVYKAAKPDGLTIGNFIGNLISQQLFGGQGIEFDARKLNGSACR
jgi:hypothetical protein